jgi:hypothetical protein
MGHEAPKDLHRVAMVAAFCTSLSLLLEHGHSVVRPGNPGTPPSIMDAGPAIEGQHVTGPKWVARSGEADVGKRAVGRALGV